MRQFPDCANARSVACCSEHVVAVVLSRQQNAILHRGRYKRGSFRRQERTCWRLWVVASPTEAVVCRAQASLARQFLGARADVPL